jgi:hypothetical protein
VLMPGVATLPALVIVTFFTLFACAGEYVEVPSIMNIAIDTAKSFEFFGVNIRHTFLHRFSLT